VFQRFCEPHVTQPINQKYQYEQWRHEEQLRTAYIHRHYLLLSQEERSGGDKKGNGHPPKVSHNAVCTGNFAAHQHANIACGREQRLGAEDKIRRNGQVMF
jgi:hypothetical protein